MSRIIDISPVLRPTTAVFPGDRPLRREVLLDRARGDVVTLSSLEGTVHLGAHVDAPSHYSDDGPTIEQVALSRLLGPCRVLRPALRGPLVGAAEVEAAWTELENGEPSPARLLIATESFPDSERWSDDFRAVDPEVFRWMVERGVGTLGVDTPSVDPASSKDLAAHGAARRHDVVLLEGLDLTGVAAGDYELIALPLRLEGFDGSPVRAVLRTLD